MSDVFAPRAAPQVWNPDDYLTYADLRLRPALDLLARVPLRTAARVVDLGCGPGNVTPYLHQRFAGAHILGVDHSAEMLSAARSAHADIATWIHADAAHWQADAPQDLIYANASLHWLDDHQSLFPRLLDCVGPGGVLAVQMPNQFDAPSHVLMREVATHGPWAAALAPLLRPSPVAEPGAYYDWLKPQCASLDIWQTTYMQTLEGPDPVLAWIASTALKPLTEALEPPQRKAFREVLAATLRTAYPPRGDATTLFPFKRLFIVAVKKP